MNLRTISITLAVACVGTSIWMLAPATVAAEDINTIACGESDSFVTSFAPTSASGVGSGYGSATEAAIEDALGYWIGQVNECEGCPEGEQGCELSFTYSGGTIQTRFDYTTNDDGDIVATGSVAVQQVDVTVSCSICEECDTGGSGDDGYVIEGEIQVELGDGLQVGGG